MSDTNKDFPNYQSLFYREIHKKLEFVDDMYEGRSVWYSPLEGIYNGEKIMRYLPRESGEPSDQYHKRIANSYFHNVFRDSIQSTAGFLNFSLNEDVLESLLEHKDNIDGKGNSIEVFFQQADIASLKHGFCLILIDYPTETPSTLYESRQLGRRPYLVLIERKDITNGRTNHKLQSRDNPITQLTIEQSLIVEDGPFGEKIIEQYRVIGDQWYQVWQEEEDTEIPALIEDGKYSLPVMPIVVYSLTGVSQNPFESSIPLYDLGEMQLQLFQKSSVKDDFMRKLCPFLQVKELNPGALGDEEITIGPNMYIKNCEASFISPGPEAMGPMQNDIDKLIEAMKLKTLAFQTGNARTATATEIRRDTASSEANLVNMARNKESAIQSVFNVWALWENKAGKGGTVTVNSAVLEKQIDLAKTELYRGLNDKGIINTEQYLSLLKEGKWLPGDFDLEEEKEVSPLATDLIPWYDLLLKYNVLTPQSVAKGISEGLDLRTILGKVENQIDEVSEGEPVEIPVDQDGVEVN